MQPKDRKVLDRKTGTLIFRIFRGQEGQLQDRPFFRNEVGPQFDGWSVLRFYSSRYRHSPRTRWRSWIEEGRIRLNGKPAHADDLLTSGDVLIFYREERPEPPVDPGYQVIHEDDHVIVVDKPAGLPVMPSGVFFRNTLLHMLRSEREGVTIHPAHRLDIGTTGLVIFTKTREAAGLLARAFRERRVTKEYRAILSGCLEREETVNVPTGRTHDPARRFSYGVTVSGKESLTIFTPLECFTQHDLTLVKAVPRTGRVHQIRIHAAHIGHPVLGDSLYGERLPYGSVAGGRLALHSSVIEFPHPLGDKQFESTPPDWFGGPFKSDNSIDKHAASG